ncbi:hypothetical protein M433DRAFT_486115 [Acidomyces richmondensis BFW]|nr:hypothetical protein M433DRAFT_486115 [Acidomyces richmondensis BFW]
MNLELKFRGLFRIPLHNLDFNLALKIGHREKNSNIRQQLLRKFNEKGCKREIECNHIIALVDECKINRLQNYTRPWTDVDCIGKVNCLNGLHRAWAAEDHLKGNDRWWTVELFSGSAAALRDPAYLKLEGLDVNCADIVEEWSGESEYSPNDVIVKIMSYQSLGEQQRADMWKLRLNDHQEKEWKCFLKSDFGRILEAMWRWPGMFDGVNFYWPKLRRMRCPEVKIFNTVRKNL